MELSLRKKGQDGGPDSAQNNASFEVLVARARTGDEDAAGVLIEKYRNYLLFLANEDVDQDLRAKIGASDAVQESMMHAQMKLQQFAGNSELEFKAWLRSILANDIRKNRRKYFAQKRDAKREVNIQEQSAVGRGLFDEHLTPSSDAIRQEKEKAIKAATSRLTVDQQQVIQLRNFEELSFEEIGSKMDRSADAARKLWARAIEALKISLKSVSPELIEGQPESEGSHE